MKGCGLRTRPGIVVDTDEVAVAGGRVIIREPPDPSAPVLLSVDVSGKLVGGNIRVRLPKPPRRSLWQRSRQELS
jgi:hypothetical protein